MTWTHFTTSHRLALQSTPHLTSHSVNMDTSVVLYALSATCFFVTANSLEKISDNGWRPTSDEKVAELRNFIKRPQNARIPEYPRHNIFQRKTEIPFIENRTIMEYEDMSYWSQKRSDIAYFEEIKKPMEIENNGNSKLKDINLNIHNNTRSKQVTREAKKVNDAIVPDSNSIYQNSKVNNEVYVTVSPNNSYKVTETIDENLEKDTDQMESETRGYTYEKPKTEAKEHNNFTKNLFSILANYNIKTSDNLPNYALSLRQNSRNSNNDYIYMKVPLKIPLKYNNANHFPIDPLLAVFLSNYGFYLPGFYGFQRNYNNLYGYLASNNMHNNKPFGSYKVFSDVDS